MIQIGCHFSAEPKAVTKDVFVLTVRYREKELIRVWVVYATPDMLEREVVDGLQDVVQGHPGPLVLLGDFNKDAAESGVPRPAQNVGVHGLPHGMDVDVEGSRGTHQRKVHDRLHLGPERHAGDRSAGP